VCDNETLCVSECRKQRVCEVVVKVVFVCVFVCVCDNETLCVSECRKERVCEVWGGFG